MKAAEQLALFGRAPVAVGGHVRNGVPVAPYLQLRARAADIPRPANARADTTEILPLQDYDHILIPFSGGKDSLATTLEMIERCDAAHVPRSRIELWHHCVDGEPGHEDFMDWPVTADYCRKVAAALGLTLRFQWREGGFRREMMRENAPTALVRFELADGTVGSAGRGESAPLGTRRRFPQVSGDLRVRWCSAALKIDVATRALNNDPRFQRAGVKILLCTGERRDEGGGRKYYAQAEKHRTTNKTRRVDAYRPVLAWNEAKIWAKIAAWGIRPHPVYAAGYSRASCATCIFHEGDEWATIKLIAPERFEEIARLEKEFNSTIQREQSVEEQAAKGTPLAPPEVLARVGPILMARDYQLPLWVSPAEWELPLGAFTGGRGPS